MNPIPNPTPSVRPASIDISYLISILASGPASIDITSTTRCHFFAESDRKGGRFPPNPQKELVPKLILQRQYPLLRKEEIGPERTKKNQKE